MKEIIRSYKNYVGINPTASAYINFRLTRNLLVRRIVESSKLQWWHSTNSLNYLQTNCLSISSHYNVLHHLLLVRGRLNCQSTTRKLRSSSTRNILLSHLNQNVMWNRCWQNHRWLMMMWFNSNQSNKLT